jgi:hypothetical protein
MIAIGRGQMSALWNDFIAMEARYYVRIMARLPPAEPAAAWMRESVDIARRVWSRSKVGAWSGSGFFFKRISGG